MAGDAIALGRVRGMARMQVSRKVVEDHIAAGDVVYGVTTGFGKFAQIAIPPQHRTELQRNLVRSHAAGVGDPFSTDTVRAMLLLRATALAKGFSGVRPELVDTRLIMVSAKAYKPDMDRARALGADHFVVKPFRCDDLLKLVEGGTTVTTQ